MQDAVYFAVSDQGLMLMDQGVRVYALRPSVEARGLSDRVHEGVHLVDYHQAIDLIMDEYDIVV